MLFCASYCVISVASGLGLQRSGVGCANLCVTWLLVGHFNSPSACMCGAPCMWGPQKEAPCILCGIRTGSFVGTRSSCLLQRYCCLWLADLGYGGTHAWVVRRQQDLGDHLSGLLGDSAGHARGPSVNLVVFRGASDHFLHRRRASAEGQAVACVQQGGFLCKKLC